MDLSHSAAISRFRSETYPFYKLLKEHLTRFLEKSAPVPGRYIFLTNLRACLNNNFLTIPAESGTLYWLYGKDFFLFNHEPFNFNSEDECVTKIRTCWASSPKIRLNFLCHGIGCDILLDPSLDPSIFLGYNKPAVLKLLAALFPTRENVYEFFKAHACLRRGLLFLAFDKGFLSVQDYNAKDTSCAYLKILYKDSLTLSLVVIGHVLDCCPNRGAGGCFFSLNYPHLNLDTDLTSQAAGLEFGNCIANSEFLSANSRTR
jgi:hypothetical protein